MAARRLPLLPDAGLQALVPLDRHGSQAERSTCCPDLRRTAVAAIAPMTTLASGLRWCISRWRPRRTFSLSSATDYEAERVVEMSLCETATGTMRWFPSCVEECSASCRPPPRLVARKPRSGLGSQSHSIRDAASLSMPAHVKRSRQSPMQGPSIHVRHSPGSPSRTDDDGRWINILRSGGPLGPIGAIQYQPSRHRPRAACCRAPAAPRQNLANRVRVI